MYQYKHSELLDLLLKFKNEGLIGQDHKVKIKGTFILNNNLLELIINKSPDLDSILLDYSSTLNQKKLISSLKSLCGDKHDSNEEEPTMQVI